MTANPITYESRSRLLWSFLVRSERKCRRCGLEGKKIASFEAVQIFTAYRSKRLLVEPLNGACLCRLCADWFRGISTDGHWGERRAAAWMQEKFANRLDQLDAIRHKPGFSWQGAYEDLLAELARRELLQAFMAHVGKDSEARKMWEVNVKIVGELT